MVGSFYQKDRLRTAVPQETK